MKRIGILCLILLVFLSACSVKEDEESQGCDLFEECGDESISLGDFKLDYESLNGQKNKNDKEYRVVEISADNPFVYSNEEEITNLLDSNESFYLYVGDKLCPWCRSSIESAIRIAKEKNIDKIYYLDIWDDEGNEIFRDKYVVEDGKLKQVIKGTVLYQRLIEDFKEFLKDYTLKSDDITYEVNEKRIFAPSYFYIENGKLIRFTEGTSKNQSSAYQELDETIVSDQEELFREFFK
ncbi:MAG: hypothetical protein IJH31_07990 [Erysipelotrichaceae bacterium]|nr:hypothetical protein [Erysipelotrichaceae bacterium]